MNPLKLAKPRIRQTIKLHRWRNDGTFEPIIAEVTGNEQGIITAKVRGEETEYALLEVNPPGGISHYMSRRKWGRFWQPMYRKTWAVLEGQPGAIVFQAQDGKAGGRASRISDQQLNMLIETRVMREMMMADLMAQQWQTLYQLVMYAVILAGIAVIAAGFGAYEVWQLSKQLGPHLIPNP